MVLKISDLFDQKFTTILKYYYSLNTHFLFEYVLKCNLFLWRKAEVSALFQSSVSHDPSEIMKICWFAAQETFMIINGENY